MEKLKELSREDPLLWQKVGLVGGVVMGILVGFVVSDRADRDELTETTPEVGIDKTKLEVIDAPG